MRGFGGRYGGRVLLITLSSMLGPTERDGRWRCLTVSVPADEVDPEFAAWLDALAVPAAVPAE